MRALAPWILPALLLAGCGTKETTPPPPAQEQPAPDASSAPAPALDPTLPAPGTGPAIQAGTKVHFHYRMLADGEVQMDTHSRGPSTYVQGSGQMFPALEKAMDGMKPGEKKSIKLSAEEAFGPRDEKALQHVPRSSFPQPDSLQVGQILGGMDQGRRVSATIKEIKPDEVVLDLNHPLAGKAVTFEVEVVSTE